MSDTTRRVRRGIAALAAGTLVAGSALVAGATPAQATDDAGHICQARGIGGFWLDNGLLTDVIHHHLEKGPIAHVVHDTVSCNVARLLRGL